VTAAAAGDVRQRLAPLPAASASMWNATRPGGGEHRQHRTHRRRQCPLHAGRSASAGPRLISIRSLAATRYIDVNDLSYLVSQKGLQTCITEMAEYIRADYLRWQDFENARAWPTTRRMA
jgi:hypothetical protein